MKSMSSTVRRFLASDAGPTAVEYAVMLALIVTVCLASISTLGSKTSNAFNDVTSALPS